MGRTKKETGRRALVPYPPDLHEMLRVISAKTGVAIRDYLDAITRRRVVKDYTQAMKDEPKP